jgi:osmoprotectant transport system permease protein
MGFIAFFIKYHNRLFMMLGQHLLMVFLSLGFSVCFALPAGFLLCRRKSISTAVIGFFSVIYSFPSLTLFTLLLPLSGLGMRTAVIVISVYAQFILLRGVVTGFRGVAPAVMEVSRGMGLSPLEILFTVQFPLAAPVLLSSLRVAVIASIGIATIGAAINSGGMGTILFEGIRNTYAVKIVWGVIFTSALSFTANQLIGRAERYCSMRARGERSLKYRKSPQQVYDVSL